MTKKRRTRRALINSVISLLICFSMLLGTTFAWFTDEVVSGKNTIAAGNLDVELVHTNAKVTDDDVASDTDLFLDLNGKEILWEPGVVAYEKMTVKNVGTLALEYQMTLNIFDENNLKGHKLSEVLKVAVIDDTGINMKDRAEVLAAAKTAVVEEVGDGLLSNFCITGKLEPKTDSEEMTVVIFWEPNDNAVDNLYNANNNQKTSDGEPLHITFGVNLQATQMMHENDSFGKDYDASVDNTPFASIVPLGAKTVNATDGIGGEASAIALDAAYQFEPTLTKEEVEESAYRYYHADFVVSADKDVPKNSIALAGYYDAWCQYNNDNWVALTADETIKAGTQIRLVDYMDMSVNYEEICDLGNDGTGFLCGLADLTGENAGTTVTVELRLYETEEPSEANNNSHNEETGEYITVATATYTFPVEKWDGTTENVPAEEENVITIMSAGELAAFAESVNNGNTYKGKTVELGTDIDLNNISWTAIGDCESGNYFQGTFDGNDRTIYNLNVDYSTDTSSHATAGLFGWVDAAGATIKNVNIDGANVEGTHWTGVIAGYFTGKIENCSVDNATVIAYNMNDDANGDKVGGIVGYLNEHSYLNDNTVSNSSVSGNREVGGIAGAVATSTYEMKNNKVTDTKIAYTTIKNYASAGAIVSGRTGYTPDDSNEAKDVTITLKVNNAEELSAAVAAGATDIYLNDGEYDVANCSGKTLNISGTRNAVLKLYNEGEDGCDYGFGSSGSNGGNITLNGVTIDTTANTGNYKGYSYVQSMTYNNCAFTGAYSINATSEHTFNNCVFDFNNGYFWTWAATKVNFNECVFNGNSKTILAHGYAATEININNCEFAATEKGYASGGTVWTAAVEIDPAGANTYTINFTGENTINENYVDWTRVKDGSTGHTITGLN